MIAFVHVYIRCMLLTTAICEVNKVFGNFKKKNNRKVTFTFSADHPDAIFECKVDNKKFKRCE